MKQLIGLHLIFALATTQAFAEDYLHGNAGTNYRRSLWIGWN